MIIRNSRGDFIEMTNFRYFSPVEALEVDPFIDPSISFYECYDEFTFDSTIVIADKEYHFANHIPTSTNYGSMVLDGELEKLFTLFNNLLQGIFPCYSHAVALFTEQLMVLKNCTLDTTNTLETPAIIFQLWPVQANDISDATKSTLQFTWDDHSDAATHKRIIETQESIREDIISIYRLKKAHNRLHPLGCNTQLFPLHGNTP